MKTRNKYSGQKTVITLLIILIASIIFVVNLPNGIEESANYVPLAFSWLTLLYIIIGFAIFVVLKVYKDYSSNNDKIDENILKKIKNKKTIEQIEKELLADGWKKTEIMIAFKRLKNLLKEFDN